jgi:glycosyltransferase involved in cell wall biosynthesis
MDYCVIIPTHNRPDLVVRALRSVYAQSWLPGEVIVIDDASEPPLVLPEEFAKARVVRHERARGGAAARNTGLREASTQIIAFLDDDDEWLPDKMEIQLAWLRAHPRATLVTCGHLRCEGGRQYQEVFSQDFVERYRQYDNFFGSFSYLVIRRPPDAGPLLDPALPALQDWDFALRVARGEKFGVIEHALVKYHAHDMPRITNRPGNHLRGLRRCFFNHRCYRTADARRWLLGRIIFERSRCIASRRKRLARVLFSIALAAGCHVPLIMKARVILRRAASLGVSPSAVVAIRSAAISGWQSLRFGRPVPAGERLC